MIGDTRLRNCVITRLITPLPRLLHPLFVAMGQEQHDEVALERLCTLSNALCVQLRRHWRVCITKGLFSNG